MIIILPCYLSLQLTSSIMYRYVFIFKIERVYKAFKQIHSIYKMERSRPNVMAFKYKVNVSSLSDYIVFIGPSCRNR